MSLVGRLVKALKYRAAGSDWDRYAIHTSYSSYNRRGVILSRINLVLPKGVGIPVLQNYEMSVRLHEIAGCQFEVEGRKVLARLSGITVEVHTAEEIFILHEIFVTQTYGLQLNNESVVIDIGMNVGIASLYFASLNCVKKVIAFEPFLPTFQQAEHNFDLNDKAGKKIIRFNVGLGGDSRTETVAYSPEHRGRVGLLGTKLIQDKLQSVEQHEIAIQRASEVLSTHIKGDDEFYLKMDCEGAEFEIIPDLVNSGLIRKFKAIMMEWHGPEVDKLVSMLEIEGFKLIRTYSSKEIGMIYAFK